MLFVNTVTKNAEHHKQIENAGGFIGRDKFVVS